MGLRVQRLRSDRGTECKAGHFNDIVSTRAYAKNLRRPIPLNKTGSSARRSDADRDGSMFTLGRRVSEVPLGRNVLTAAFLVNSAPHKALEMETPYKHMHGKDANLRMLRTIGARAFV